MILIEAEKFLVYIKRIMVQEKYQDQKGIVSKLNFTPTQHKLNTKVTGCAIKKERRKKGEIK